jgi:hypothetical protein
MTTKTLFLAALCFTGAAYGGPVPDPAFFGRLDMAGMPKPQLMSKRPVRAVGLAHDDGATPLVLHVPPGQERRWGAACQAYGACGVPVLFVTEAWYRQVYLPRVGAQDGREQRYLELVRVVRDERDQRHRADDDE